MRNFHVNVYDYDYEMEMWNKSKITLNLIDKIIFNIYLLFYRRITYLLFFTLIIYYKK